MLGNNASDEDSFITCQTTLENHGSLLDSLVNMQSRNPFSGQIVADYVFFWQGLLDHPFKMHFDFHPLLRKTFAELSQKYPYSQTPAISRGRIKEKQTPGALAFGSCKASLLETWLLHLELVS